MSVFRLPDLGEGLQDGEIVEWHVNAGDRVVADQPLLAIETDKAVIEIPAPRSGRIARLMADLGERVPVGAPLVEFAEAEAPDRGAVVGDLAAAPSASTRPLATAAAPAVKASPAVRTLAARLGVDLAHVSGSGPGGAVVAADVEGAAQGRAGEGFEGLTGVRLAMARNMARSRDEICPASVTEEADVSAWPADIPDVTIRLIQALIVGCRRVPALNAWFDGRTEARRLHQEVAVAVAIDTPDGLFAPVIHDAGALDQVALRQELDTLKSMVLDRRITHERLAGATVTLSNFGIIGGLHAAMAVVPPQVAALGAGRIVRRLALDDGTTVERRLMPLSLTFDHRAVSGGEAARFLSAVAGALRAPA